MEYLVEHNSKAISKQRRKFYTIHKNLNSSEFAISHGHPDEINRENGRKQQFAHRHQPYDEVEMLHRHQNRYRYEHVPDKNPGIVSHRPPLHLEPKAPLNIVKDSSIKSHTPQPFNSSKLQHLFQQPKYTKGQPKLISTNPITGVLPLYETRNNSRSLAGYGERLISHNKSFF